MSPVTSWSVAAVAIAAAVALCACGAADAGRPPPPIEPPRAHADLKPASAFATIADRDERARALFLEATRVLLDARCTNCHPNDDSPRQRGGEAHEPPIVRGPEDRGPPGQACTTCHQDTNLAHARVPGAPDWHLAPRGMAWVGRTAGQVCEQIKDPARNGNKTLAQIVEHVAHDPLVAWGWSPGADRTPVAGTQAGLAQIVEAWVAAGAACPTEPEKKEASR